MTNDFNKTENDSTKTRNDKWQIIDEEFISYTGGTAQLISNGECTVHLWETPKDAQLFCDKLNELNNENTFLRENNKALRKQRNEYADNNMQLYHENTTIKQTLNDMIENERTELGKSVLMQFKEAIE